MAMSGQVRPGQSRADQSRPEQTIEGRSRPDQNKSEQNRTKQTRADQNRRSRWDVYCLQHGRGLIQYTPVLALVLGNMTDGRRMTCGFLAASPPAKLSCLAWLRQSLSIYDHDIGKARTWARTTLLCDMHVPKEWS